MSKEIQLAEENPGLNYDMIKDIIVSLEQKKVSDITDYVFDDE